MQKFPCPIVDLCIRSFPQQSPEQTFSELSRLHGKIVGTILSKEVVFSPQDKASKDCLTRFYDRGTRQAEVILPFIRPDDEVLDYGGGIGRLGHWIAPHCRSYVSVDIDPLSVKYGPVIVPEINFALLEDLPDIPTFTFAFSVAVLFHLNLEQQQVALRYVYDRLKPNGRFLVDLRVGDTELVPDRKVREGRVIASEFINFCTQYYSVVKVKLFNDAFLLVKRDRPLDRRPAGSSPVFHSHEPEPG